MNYARIAGVSLLAMVWIWLVAAIINNGGGFTLKNLFIIVCSGIIIFVPLWKKYFRKDSDSLK